MLGIRVRPPEGDPRFTGRVRPDQRDAALVSRKRQIGKRPLVGGGAQQQRIPGARPRHLGDGVVDGHGRAGNVRIHTQRDHELRRDAHAVEHRRAVVQLDQDDGVEQRDASSQEAQGVDGALGNQAFEFHHRPWYQARSSPLSASR